ALEEQRAPSGFHFPVRILDAHATLVGPVTVSTRPRDVVTKTAPLFPQHASRGIHSPGHLHTGDELGNANGVARLEDDVCSRAPVPQRTRQIDVNAARIVQDAHELDARRVRLRGEAPGAVDQVGQTLIFRPQRVGAGESYLTAD